MIDGIERTRPSRLDRWLVAYRDNPDTQLQLLTSYATCGSRSTLSGAPCGVLIRLDRRRRCPLHEAGGKSESGSRAATDPGGLQGSE